MSSENNNVDWKVALKPSTLGFSAPDGEHAAVTNQAPQTTAAVKKLSEPPKEGKESQSIIMREEGIEDVKGYKRTALTEAARVHLFVTPRNVELRDVAEASFGPPQAIAEDVHGPDDRIQITETTQYPWQALCSLLITAADDSLWIGTGWFISPRTVVTAGHCVCIKNNPIPQRNGWVKNIKVMPGRNGSTLPYGSVTSTIFRSVGGWINDGDSNFDYGVIIIPTPLGNSVGWFGLGAYTDDDLKSTTGNIAGFPADKPEGTLWYHSNSIPYVDAHNVYYDIDTMGGQSGSPVYRGVDQERFAFAIHAYGGATTNSGTRITTEVYNNLVSWKE